MLGKKLPIARQILYNFLDPTFPISENKNLCRSVLNTSLLTIISTSVFFKTQSLG